MRPFIIIFALLCTLILIIVGVRVLKTKNNKVSTFIFYIALFLSIIGLSTQFSACSKKNTNIKNSPRIIALQKNEKWLQFKKIWKKLDAIESKSTNSLSQGPLAFTSYDTAFIFIGTDPTVAKPILTNSAIQIYFYTRFNPSSVAKILELIYPSMIS